MKKIKITDITLYESENTQNNIMGFKEKVELVKQLDKLGVDTIQLNEINNQKTDILFYKTIASIIKNSTISCPAKLDTEKTEEAFKALKESSKKRINVIVPLSAVQIEYFCEIKPEKLPDKIKELVEHALTLCKDVEFTAEDAMRSEPAFLIEAISAAVKAGAKIICISDSAGTSLPEEIYDTITSIKENVEGIENCTLSIKAGNALSLATANVFSAIKAEAGEIKTSINGLSTISIEKAVSAIAARGATYQITTNIETTQLKRTVSQLKRRSSHSDVSSASNLFDEVLSENNGIELTENSTLKQTIEAIHSLGYELTEDDNARVHEAVIHVAKSKKVSAKELDAIIASEALQVPQTYKLISYVTNSGNILTATSNITMEKNGEKFVGLCSGDGPIDSSFLAIEQIAGRHFELDDFQIQSVTEGREAMGEAIVKLRHNGVLYSGRGTSTDIIGASIKAYISALNKIVYEENVI